MQENTTSGVRIVKALVPVSLVFVILLGGCASSPPVNGDWDVSLVAPEGQTGFTMTVAVDGESAIATTGDSTFEGTYRDGRLELTGDFYVPEAGYSAPLNMDVRFAEDRLDGTATWDAYSADATGTRAE